MMDRTLVIKFDPRTVVILGAALVMLAAWLPWSSLPSFLVGDLARQGFAAGGFLTFAMGVLALLGLLLPWRPLGRVSLLAAILAVVIDVVTLIALVRVIQLSARMEMNLGAQLKNMGSGLYLTFAGAWLMLFGGLASAYPLPDRSWLSYAAWVGMGGLLLAGCLCAWSIGLILRPVTLASPATPAATFGPAPTAYMATPLVDVQLEPFSPGPRAPASPTPNRPGNPTAVPSGQNIPPSPTARRGSPTSTSPTPSTLTPTFVPPGQATPTRSPTAATRTPTTTASPTLTPTPTPTTFNSPIGTPTTTPTASPTITTTTTSTPTSTPET